MEHKIIIWHTPHISKSLNTSLVKKDCIRVLFPCVCSESDLRTIWQKETRCLTLFQSLVPETDCWSACFHGKVYKKHPIFNGCWVNCAGPVTFCSIYRFLNYHIRTVFQTQRKPTQHSYFDTSLKYIITQQNRCFTTFISSNHANIVENHHYAQMYFSWRYISCGR